MAHGDLQRKLDNMEAARTLYSKALKVAEDAVPRSRT